MPELWEGFPYAHKVPGTVCESGRKKIPWSVKGGCRQEVVVGEEADSIRALLQLRFLFQEDTSQAGEGGAHL